MKLKILISTLTVILFSFQMTNAQKVTEVNSKQVNEMLQKKKNLVVLDVRTSGEFNEGHIKGAKNIDILQPDAFSKIDKLDHSATYVVHCRTNRRSSKAVEYMKSHGFKNIYQMMDGSTGWAENRLPVEK